MSSEKQVLFTVKLTFISNAKSYYETVTIEGVVNGKYSILFQIWKLGFELHPSPDKVCKVNGKLTNVTLGKLDI